MPAVTVAGAGAAVGGALGALAAPPVPAAGAELAAAGAPGAPAPGEEPVGWAAGALGADPAGALHAASASASAPAIENTRQAHGRRLVPAIRPSPPMLTGDGRPGSPPARAVGLQRVEPRRRSQDSERRPRGRELLAPGAAAGGRGAYLPASSSTQPSAAATRGNGAFAPSVTSTAWRSSSIVAPPSSARLACVMNAPCTPIVAKFDETISSRVDWGSGPASFTALRSAWKASAVAFELSVTISIGARARLAVMVPLLALCASRRRPVRRPAGPIYAPAPLAGATRSRGEIRRAGMGGSAGTSPRVSTPGILQATTDDYNGSGHGQGNFGAAQRRACSAAGPARRLLGPPASVGDRAGAGAVRRGRSVAGAGGRRCPGRIPAGRRLRAATLRGHAAPGSSHPGPGR